MKSTTSKRGGARPGSGRPPLPPELRRVRIMISVLPATAATFRKLREAGKLTTRDLGGMIDSFVNSVSTITKEGML